MTSLLRDLFGVGKPVIAMLHLPALPGRPRHDRRAGMRPVIEAVARDLAALQDAGVDGLLFCNEADLPYQLGVGPEAVAVMAAVIGAVRREISRPFGVNLVWDPVASLAVARATGASFVREVFTGVYESDLGVMRPDFGAIGAYRSGIGAESVALFANITPNNHLTSYLTNEEKLAGVYITEKVDRKTGWQFVCLEEEWTRGYLQEIQDFMECVSLGRQPLADAALAYATMKVNYAAYWSAEEGRRIALS